MPYACSCYKIPIYQKFKVNGQILNFLKKSLCGPLGIFSCQICKASKSPWNDFVYICFNFRFQTDPFSLKGALKYLFCSKIVLSIAKPSLPTFQVSEHFGSEMGTKRWEPKMTKCIRGSVGCWVHFMIFGPPRVCYQKPLRNRLIVSRSKIDLK